MSSKPNRYQSIIEDIFFQSYVEGVEEIPFRREDLVESAKRLGIELPKNLGDVIYSARYRVAMPDRVTATQTDEKEWVIEGQGRSQYSFKLLKVNRIIPNEDLLTIKIPDATPQIVNEYSLSDEQALLAKIRYNRLIDIFLGITTYSLQNHLRTTVKEIGQIEIDEIYVGINETGTHYVIPVQAKGGSDQLSVVQTKQDIKCCSEKYPNLICRAISAQFIEEDHIALFELTTFEQTIKIVNERHYRLVSSDMISSEDMRTYQDLNT